jgi:hypothetical protein
MSENRNDGDRLTDAQIDQVRELLARERKGPWRKNARPCSPTSAKRSASYSIGKSSASRTR